MMKGIRLGVILLTVQEALTTPVLVSTTAAPAAPTAIDDLFPLPSGYQSQPDLYEGMKPSVPEAKIVKKRLGLFKLARGAKPIKTDDTSDASSILVTPCQDCWVTAIQAKLSFKNGTAAHAAHNIKLQHMSLDTGDRDEYCRTYNLYKPQRLYITGDERETVRFNIDGQKYGHYIRKPEEKKEGEADNTVEGGFITARWDAVNMGQTPAEIYFDVMFEVIPNEKATGYKKVIAIVMDIAGCGETLPARPSSTTGGQYDLGLSLQGYLWSSTVEGKVILISGHVHEGAVSTTFWINDEAVCTLAPLYGRKRTSVDPAGRKHISDEPVCMNVGKVEKGSVWDLTAFYDFNEHPWDATRDGNAIAPIMAINQIYVGMP